MPFSSKLLTLALVPVLGVTLYRIAVDQPDQATGMRIVRAQNMLLDLSGKRSVVVGGTSGIGRGVAIRLAKAGSSVTIVGRSEERGRAVVQSMREAYSQGPLVAKNQEGSGEQQQNYEPEFLFHSCDCFSLGAVRGCADVLLEELGTEAQLDFLVQTQGMATLQGFTPTQDGLDQKLTLHYWSRAAFAQSLLPALRNAKKGTFMSVLSAGIHSAYGNWKTDPELKAGSYGIKKAADSAGFYNDIMCESLALENADSNVTFIHAAPGFIATNWGTEMPTIVRWLVRGLQKLFARSEEDCAEYMVAALTTGASEPGFMLVDQYGMPTAKTLPEQKEARTFVWDHTKAVIAAGKSVQKVSKSAS